MDDLNRLFYEYQNDLLWMANSEAGRFLLGTKSKSPIVLLTPNSFHELMDMKNGRPILRGTFFGGAPIAMALSPILTKMLIAEQEHVDLTKRYEAFLHFSGLEIKNRIYPKIFLTTTTFNPPNGNGSLHDRDRTDWTSCREATSCTEVPNNSHVYGVESQVTGGHYYLARGFQTFLTGTVLQSALSISAAVFSLYGYTNADQGNGHTIAVAASTQANPTSLAQADWDAFTMNSPTEFCTRKAFSGWSTSAYNDMTFNANGISGLNVVAGGYTKLVLRPSIDVDNAGPAAGDNYVGWWIQDDADAAKYPKLTVTYIASSIKKLSGVPYASLKKVSGVAIASVKKVSSIA